MSHAHPALHPAAFEADITAPPIQRQPYQVPYFVVRGNSLEECTLRLRRTQPGLPLDGAQLGLGTRLVRADGETLFLGV